MIPLIITGITGITSYVAGKKSDTPEEAKAKQLTSKNRLKKWQMIAITSAVVIGGGIYLVKKK